MNSRFDFSKLNDWQSGLTGLKCSCKSNGMGLHYGKQRHSFTYTFLTVLVASLATTVVTWFLFRPCKLKVFLKEETAKTEE